MKYLEIHNEKDGKDVFKMETRYDWYILKNQSGKNTLTRIKFQSEPVTTLNIQSLEFIPNGQVDLVSNLIAKHDEDKVELLFSRSDYGIDKKWMSKSQNEIFNKPCVYTVNSESKASLYYSSKDNGHFGLPKLIWSNGRISSIGSYIDHEGKFGLTQFAYAIVDKKSNLKKIKKAFDSKKFRDLMELCAVGQLTVNHKVIASFRKEFWKDFL